jgi:parvulin-like peptidyl-prolyl isomerase
MAKKAATVVLWLIVICGIGGLILGIFPLSGAKNQEKQDIQQRIALANDLQQEGLAAEAIREFDIALHSQELPDTRKASISYLVANLYFEKLKDYEKALAYYVRSKHYNPQSSEQQKIEQRTVECLEKLGRSADAQYKLSEATYLAGEKAARYPGRVVAKLGDREITMGEIEAEIQKLPPYQREHYQNDAGKLEFLKMYIANELMHTAALRKGYQDDPTLLEQVNQFKKMLMIRKVYDEQVKNAVTITPTEMNLYYQAHKHEFTEPKKLKIAHILVATEEDAQQVRTALQQGADFSTLASERSLDEQTKTRGGQIGFVNTSTCLIPTIGKNETLVHQLELLNPGDCSDVVKTDRGYHIFKLLEVQPERQQNFDEVKDQIEAALRHDKEQEREHQLIENLMKAQNVIIYEAEFEESQAQPTQTPTPKSVPEPAE